MAREKPAPEPDELPFRFPATLAEAAACGLCPECYAAPVVPAPRVEPEPDEEPNV